MFCGISIPGGCCVVDPLLQELLRASSFDAAPVFLASNLRALNPPRFSVLLEQGVLRVTTLAKRIPRPIRCGAGPDFVVRPTAHGLFGMPDDENWGEPQRLEEAEVQRVVFSFQAFCRSVQDENKLSGGAAASATLGCIGRKSAPGLGHIEVWLAVAISNPSALLDAARRLRERSKVAKLLLLHPTPILDPMPALPEGLVATALTELLATPSLSLDWELVHSLFGRAEPDELVVERQAGVWRVRRLGKEVFIKDQVGMLYVDHLVAHPGEPIHAVDLANSVLPKGQPQYRRGEGSDEPTPEDTALLQSAREKLKEDRDVASEDENQKQVTVLTERIAEIDRRIEKSQGFGGRKKESGDNAKARKAVSAAITRVIADLHDISPEIEKFLRDYLNLGAECIYLPPSLTAKPPLLQTM